MNQEQPCCPELSRYLSPKLFKALGDSNRVLLLARLAQNASEQTVTDVAQGMSIDVSVVSRHLAILRDSGILEARKRGRQVFYRVRIAALAQALRALADALEACCPSEYSNRGIDEAASAVEEIDQ
jgi:ArsR family transcriptional regulator, arsenate/arsenite/antimonite-responsive transcriptional repressor